MFAASWKRPELAFSETLNVEDANFHILTSIGMIFKVVETILTISLLAIFIDLQEVYSRLQVIVRIIARCYIENFIERYRRRKRDLFLFFVGIKEKKKKHFLKI